MEVDFRRAALLFKALSDENRLKVAHVLSCGELCACEILEYLDVTQPTLSHHLAVLTELGLVVARPEGKWIHYSLDRTVVRELEGFVGELFREHETCACKKERRMCS